MNPAYKYLTVTRALSLAVMPSDLRYHPRLKYRDPASGVVTTSPALVAAIRNVAGEIVSVHGTLLTTNGDPAPIFTAEGKRANKRIMASPVPGITKGGAIRLYPASEVLGVAEGIETAIACQNLTGIPVWSGVHAGGLETMVIPPEVLQVVIFADNDDNGRGETAAIKLATRLTNEGRTVKILEPSQRRTDWADIAKGEPNR